VAVEWDFKTVPLHIQHCGSNLGWMSFSTFTRYRQRDPAALQQLPPFSTIGIMSLSTFLCCVVNFFPFAF